MMHAFLFSTVGNNCMVCGRDEISHGPNAVCDSCGAVGQHEMLNHRVLCKKCYDELLLASKQRRATDNPEIEMDFFNQAVTSIAAKRAEILSDETLPQDKRAFAFANWLDEFYRERKQKLFDIKKQEQQTANEIKAIQVTYNQLAAKLREEERAKLTLQDINYKPQPPKKAPTARVSKPSKKTLNKAELKLASEKYNLPEALIQTVCVARGVEPLVAAEILMAATKADS